MLGLELAQPSLLRFAQPGFALGLCPLEGLLLSVGKSCSEPEGELQAVKSMLVVCRHQVHHTVLCCEVGLEVGFDPACLEVDMAKLAFDDDHRKAVSVAGVLEVNKRWHVAVIVSERHLRRAPRQDAAGRSAVDGIAQRPSAHVDAQDCWHAARRAREDDTTVQPEARDRGSDG